jgi:hypothetical protein
MTGQAEAAPGTKWLCPHRGRPRCSPSPAKPAAGNPRRLQLRLVSAAGRILRGGRRLRIPSRWPWAAQITTATTRLQTAHQASQTPSPRRPGRTHQGSWTVAHPARQPDSRIQMARRARRVDRTPAQNEAPGGRRCWVSGDVRRLRARRVALAAGRCSSGTAAPLRPSSVAHAAGQELRAYLGVVPSSPGPNSVGRRPGEARGLPARFPWRHCASQHALSVRTNRRNEVARPRAHALRSERARLTLSARSPQHHLPAR